MWLKKSADAIYKMAEPLSKALVFVGAMCLAAMMFLMVSDVVMRYFFDKPIRGAFDLTEYMMAVVFSFGLPYCIINKNHIKVDILMERFSEKAQTVINMLLTPVSLVIFSLIAWQSILSTKIQFDSHIVSSVLEIPRYPFLALVFLGYTCFAVVLLADVLNLIAKVVRR